MLGAMDLENIHFYMKLPSNIYRVHLNTTEEPNLIIDNTHLKGIGNTHSNAF